jgi:hypothetical protein
VSDRSFTFLIDLPVQNEWENVDLLRTSVLNCFTAIFKNMEGCHSFATVASELMENAIKYGAWENADSHLRLRVWGDAYEAFVQVENPVEPSSDGVRELTETIAWLGGFATPEEAYRARMLEVAQSPRGVTKLGLARIVYEGRCKLSAVIDGQVLRVTGVTSL